MYIMNFFKIFSITFLALTAVALTACNDDNGAKYKPRADIQLTQEQKAIAESGNEFAVNAFKAINSNDSNVLISPYGMQLTLAMMANGAKGETLREITSAMHTGAATAADLNAYYKTLTKALVDADDRVAVNFLSAFWYAKGLSANPDFTAALSNAYGATSSSIDFSSPDALGTINGWVSKATSGKVSKLFSYLPPETQACLASTMTFHGRWSQTLLAFNNVDSYFTNNKGEKEKCTMFGYWKTDANIAQGDDANMLELEYGNGSFVMDVIVPKDSSKINEYVAGLSIQKINTLLANLRGSVVNLEMPKFEATYSNDLIGAFKTLGVNKIFGGGDLSGIANTDMQITQYLQQMRINVDEEGTKITVSTGWSGDPTGIIGNMWFIDSPFVYLIRERSTGVILAIGKVQTMAGMQ